MTKGFNNQLLDINYSNYLMILYKVLGERENIKINNDKNNSKNYNSE